MLKFNKLIKLPILISDEFLDAENIKTLFLISALS